MIRAYVSARWPMLSYVFVRLARRWLYVWSLRLGARPLPADLRHFLRLWRQVRDLAGCERGLGRLRLVRGLVEIVEDAEGHTKEAKS